MSSTLSVDMMAQARTAQFDPVTFLGPGFVKALAPAKVNLVLAVGPRQDDGLHEVTTVMHALALHDLLYLNALPIEADDERFTKGNTAWQAVGGPADNVLVTIDMVEKGGAAVAPVEACDNLAFAAVDALARAISHDAPTQVAMRIEKHIPSQAGLGGGSSDAAAVLLGLAKLWDLDPDDERIARVAQGLGSDVAFFLHGGCSLLDGSGSHFVRELESAKDSVVLVRPDAGIDTARAYRVFDEDPQPVPAEVTAALEGASSARDLVRFNSLTPEACELVPEVADVLTWADAQPGVQDALLCGSGSCVALFVDGLDAAMAVCAAAGAQGWWARTTALSKISACVMG